MMYEKNKNISMVTGKSEYNEECRLKNDVIYESVSIQYGEYDDYISVEDDKSIYEIDKKCIEYYKNVNK